MLPCLHTCDNESKLHVNQFGCKKQIDACYNPRNAMLPRLHIFDSEFKIHSEISLVEKQLQLHTQIS